MNFKAFLSAFVLIFAANQYPALGQSEVKIPADREIKTWLYGLAIDEGGAYYVSSKSGYILKLEDFSDKEIRDFGTFGTGNNNFRSCWSVAIHNKEIFVVDQKNQRLVVCGFDSSIWKEFDFNQGDLMTLGLRGLHVDKQGRIYIADEGKHRIIRMDNIEGENLMILGSYGNGENQFSGPGGIASDEKGRIYVADSGNNRIVRMDDMTGAGWVTFGSPGKYVNQFNSPYNLVIDSSGRIIVADSHNGRLVRINNMAGDGWVEWKDKSDFYAVVTSVVVTPRGQVVYLDQTSAKLCKIDDFNGAGYTFVSLRN